MKRKFIKALSATTSSILLGLTLSSCMHYDYTLVIYNWEDYIFEGTDEYGNIIMDFSIYDAKQAGFEKVVFIIKKENEGDKEGAY